MKTILILSTEPWGKMLLSKMHYALELAESGNAVFFVNPPRKIKGKMLAQLSNDHPAKNLKVINTKLIPGALFLRHKIFRIYKILSSIYTNQIKAIVDNPINEVWCFDPFLYVDLKKFNADKSILLIYDFYKEKIIFNTATTADAVISISKPILDFYKAVDRPKLLLQHGLGSCFSKLATKQLVNENLKYEKRGKLKIGYVGNLLRAAINVDIAREIISKHTDKEFHFWGPYSLEENNVSPTDVSVSEELVSFIKYLQNQPNVILHGIMEQELLSEQLFTMDVFLFLYSATKDINGASNSHKIIEYLSTGKAVVSTFILNYAEADLLIMSPMNDEHQVSELFDQVTDNLQFYNSTEFQKKRICFALDNTYRNQINRINKFIYN